MEPLISSRRRSNSNGHQCAAVRLRDFCGRDSAQVHETPRNDQCQASSAQFGIVDEEEEEDVALGRASVSRRSGRFGGGDEWGSRSAAFAQEVLRYATTSKSLIL